MWVKKLVPDHAVNCLRYNTGGLFTDLRSYKMGKTKAWYLVSKRELEMDRLCEINNIYIHDSLCCILKTKTKLVLQLKR